MLLLFILSMVSLAPAQASRTWVSGTGDDVNPCSRTAPCKTFAGAISKTAEHGEIDALDPAGFGSVTITKSMTIDGTGTLAGSLPGGSAFIVNVTTNPTTATVIIRNIQINGAQAGLDGVRYLAGNTLVVEGCLIHGFSGDGIDANLAANGNLKVLDTLIEDVDGDGIRVGTAAGFQLLATIDRTRVMNATGDGFEATDRVRALITNSTFAHNTNAGIKTSGTDSLLNIDDVSVSYSLVGMESSSGSELRVSDSIIAQNATGLSTPAGSILSFQGNSLMGNTTAGAFSGVATSKQ
jgi:hypothetical protein